MNTIILTKSYDEMPFCEREILRYAGTSNAGEDTVKLMRECIDEARTVLSYNVCYCILPVDIIGSTCDFSLFSLQSFNLAKNLRDCENVVLSAATVGIKLDRLINKYGKISPSKALFFQAIGTERIEALCDIFCKDIECEYKMGQRPRFSPGYGDLELSTQEIIFNVLGCEKRIGLTLTEGFLMSPSKSVTSFVGLSKEKIKNSNYKCSSCSMKDCQFRGVYGL